jgi:hypothetical protein
MFRNGGNAMGTQTPDEHQAALATALTSTTLDQLMRSGADVTDPRVQRYGDRWAAQIAATVVEPNGRD